MKTKPKLINFFQMAMLIGDKTTFNWALWIICTIFVQ